MFFLSHSPPVDSGAEQKSPPVKRELHTIIILQYV